MKLNESAQDFVSPLKGDSFGAVGTRESMEHLCWYLGHVLQRDERPVIDRTGLTGRYDFTLSFGLDLPPESLGFVDRPSIFTALKEQLGLKLEPQKGPVEYYLIDHVEKPEAN
jgi:uncharacterized protein (TIGR03435 family)